MDTIIVGVMFFMLLGIVLIPNNEIALLITFAAVLYVVLYSLLRLGGYAL